MIFRRKRESAGIKLARTAGRTAGTVVRAATKAAVAAGIAGVAARRAAAEIGGAVSRGNDAARRALARRRSRQRLERVSRSLKTVGKAVAIAGLSAAAVETARRMAKPRRRRSA
jgi:hypothetical protein